MTAAAMTAPPMVSVPKLWPGETVVVFGGGPSLTREDVDYCRGKARAIAIKEAWQLAPWADAMYGCDAKFWRYYGGVPSFDGLKFALEPQQKWPGVQVLRNLGAEGLSLDPTGLTHGNNSGYQAIGLAVHLGAARIVLLGFDMWQDEHGQQNWFGKHPNHVDSPYAVFLHRFTTIVEPLKAAGVEVINCSRRTMLKAFPRQPLEEVL